MGVFSHIVDSAIGVFSPAAEYRRKVWRDAHAQYKAVNKTRLHNPDRSRGSANSIVSSSQASIAEQVRHHEENNSFVDAAITSLVNNVVGPDGIGVEPMPMTFDGQVHKEFSKTLSRLFFDWGLKCSVDGSDTWVAYQQLICRAWLRDGEVFSEDIEGSVSGFKHPNGVIQYSIQAFESEFVPINFNDSGKGINQGIQFNGFGQRTAYHRYSAHPSGDVFAFKKKKIAVSVDRINHLCLKKRLHQLRGISIFASSLIDISSLASYEESEIASARVAAALALVIKKGDGEDFDVKYYDGSAKADPKRKIGLAPGSTVDLNPGESVEVLESKRPNSFGIAFCHSIYRKISSAIGGSFSTIMRVYDGNFSARRQELIDATVGYRVLSNEFIADFVRPVYRKFVRMAVLGGVVEVPSDVDVNSLFFASYSAPKMPWIDPMKEISAYEKKVKAGFGTEAGAIREMGGNPEEVKAQRVKEIQENKEWGLYFSSDSGHEYRKDKEGVDGKNDGSANGVSSGS